MLAWFAELTPRERRTMAACFGGWSLDAFDVQIYSFVIPTLLATWHISRGEAGLLGTVTLAVSAFGGWFAGALGDRYGRVRVLQITILWYAFFTFLCGFRAELRATVRPARAAGLRLRRRMGGRRGADGRDDPRQVSRPRRRLRAERLGGRLGRRGAGLHRCSMPCCPRRPPGACCSGSALRRRYWCSGSAAPSRSRRSSRRGAASTPIGLAQVFSRAAAAVSGDHAQGRADGDGRAGRLLRAVGLVADLSQDRAASELAEHRLLSAVPHLRRVLSASWSAPISPTPSAASDLHGLGARLGAVSV